MLSVGARTLRQSNCSHMAPAAMADPNRSLKRLSNYYVTLCAHVLAAGLDFHSLTHVIIQMCSIESVPARRSFLMTAPYTWGALLKIISLISPTIMKLNYLVLQFKYAQHDQQLCRRFRYARKQPPLHTRTRKPVLLGNVHCAILELGDVRIEYHLSHVQGLGRLTSLLSIPATQTLHRRRCRPTCKPCPASMCRTYSAGLRLFGPQVFVKSC